MAQIKFPRRCLAKWEISHDFAANGLVGVSSFGHAEPAERRRARVVVIAKTGCTARHRIRRIAPDGGSVAAMSVMICLGRDTSPKQNPLERQACDRGHTFARTQPATLRPHPRPMPEPLREGHDDSE